MTNPPHLYMQSAPFEKYIDCMTGHSYISLIILACYKLVLAIIGSVLAVQNRRVNIPELREAKVVGVATYAFLFAITVTVATIFAVKDTRIRAIIVSVEGLCAVTFLLAILFVPKVGAHIHLHSAVAMVTVSDSCMYHVYSCYADINGYSVYNCSTLLQLYRALRVTAGKEEGTEGSTTVTEHSIVDGLDNLQKHTLSAMQSEIDALKQELKRSGKVCAILQCCHVASWVLTPVSQTGSSGIGYRMHEYPH